MHSLGRTITDALLFFRICFLSVFQFGVFVVISAMSFVCCIFPESVFFCYLVRFRFVVSEFSQHIQCLSLQPAHVGTCSHRKVRIEQKFKFFKKKKWTRIPKNAFHNRSNPLFITEKCKRMQFSFHLLQSQTKFFLSVFRFLFYFSLLLLSSWKSTGNLCSPHLKTELILLFRTRTIFSAI